MTRANGIATVILVPRQRRFLSGAWRPLAALFAVCSVYALTRNLGRTGELPEISQYLNNFWESFAVFSLALIAMSIAAALLPRRHFFRPAALTIAMMLGVTLGFALATGPSEILSVWHETPLMLTAVAPFMGIGMIGLALFLVAERHDEAKWALHAAAERNVALERATAEVRLALLYAQVEPHFLFNTLAHLRRLFSTEPAKGGEMLRNLMRYIGEAHAALGRESLTLAEDMRLAEAYVGLQRVRMGSRLNVSIDLPLDTQKVRVPPMMLTTLLENCVEHALSPLPEGGAVHVSAYATGASTRIDVSDNGRGFTTSAGSGVGLSNLRARLAVLHGDAAALELRQNAAGGVTATVIVPSEQSGEADDAA